MLFLTVSHSISAFVNAVHEEVVQHGIASTSTNTPQMRIRVSATPASRVRDTVTPPPSLSPSLSLFLSLSHTHTHTHTHKHTNTQTHTHTHTHLHTHYKHRHSTRRRRRNAVVYLYRYTCAPYTAARRCVRGQDPHIRCGIRGPAARSTTGALQPAASTRRLQARRGLMPYLHIYSVRRCASAPRRLCASAWALRRCVRARLRRMYRRARACGGCTYLLRTSDGTGAA